MIQDLILHKFSVLTFLSEEYSENCQIYRGGSRTAAASKMEHFVIIVNDWKPLTIITKRSILNVGADLDPPLI